MLMILIILSTFLCSIYILSFNQTKVIETSYVRLKVTHLIIRSKVDNFWQGEMYANRNDIKNMPQNHRIDYFVAVLYTLTDKLQKSGEATLIYYEIIPYEDKIMLYEKLNELETTEYFKDLEIYEKDYIRSIKEVIKLSSMIKPVE